MRTLMNSCSLLDFMKFSVHQTPEDNSDIFVFISWLLFIELTYNVKFLEGKKNKKN